MTKIVIIGGGASGIVSSIYAKNDNNEVIVLERNSSPLKKLLMTGNGKCNYYNENQSLDNYHSNNMEIVEKIIIQENLDKVEELFNNLGIVPKIKNGYYYPFSNQATTIKNALEKFALKKGVIIKNNFLVESIEKDNNKFIVKTNEKEIECDKLVISTGGCAYPKTGSDGMGYDFLKKLNHTIIKPLPALVQLLSDFKYKKEWQGIRTDVELELFEDKNYITKEEGEIQLTDYGISGICTFNLSHYVSRGLDKNKKEEININFVPFIKTLITPWMDNFSKINKDKNIKELLEGILNYKLVNIILKISNIEENVFYKDLTNEEKLRLCKNLKSMKINITGTKSFDSSQVCNGGVVLTEINEKTFESKIVNNLYIIGELLDINGNCGGYNLTIAWLSGILSGLDIGEKND